MSNHYLKVIEDLLRENKHELFWRIQFSSFAPFSPQLVEFELSLYRELKFDNIFLTREATFDKIEELLKGYEEHFIIETGTQSMYVKDKVLSGNHRGFISFDIIAHRIIL